MREHSYFPDIDTANKFHTDFNSINYMTILYKTDFPPLYLCIYKKFKVIKNQYRLLISKIMFKIPIKLIFQI